jgi:hypothetical protein
MGSIISIIGYNLLLDGIYNIYHWIQSIVGWDL